MNENFAKKTRPTINYLVTLVFYIVIFIATILSVLIETGHSTSLSIGWFDFICPIFLRSKIIFETMKIIGFASLFIGFIQANLDKTILGLKNTDLLLFKFKGYGVFTAFHFAFTIACIMFSAILSMYQRLSDDKMRYIEMLKSIEKCREEMINDR